ncbi:PREDICTED: uncharacterized protein LOC101374865 [Odobenus rosmarus divergens]|uniref:Uncharacterized protein LOC101374865 n=1 Tax=Odobenus rosmarus divergens TaxID=9708 RepID=A0A2U3VQK4_ODORO
MPREKEGRQKAKGTPLPIVPILQKFLKTYEKHCAQTQTSVCLAIKQDLKTSINNEQILRKFMLVRPEDSPTSILPISLEPLLMTIRDECYMLGKEICIWSLQLSNPEIARLASLLELKGRAACPFTSLELIDCRMDLWALGRLGRALPCSCLRSLVLDYCRFGSEEIESIFSGLENNQRLQALSLRYCGLGPQSGPRLGAIIYHSSICELHLDGNYLQCSGALTLLRPVAEYAKTQGRDQPATSPPDPGSPPQQLQESQTSEGQRRPQRAPALSFFTATRDRVEKLLQLDWALCQTEGKFNFEPDYKVTWSSNRENYFREGEAEKRYLVVVSAISLHLPLSVNHFLLSWAVCSRYDSNYPKQKNYGEIEEPVSYGFL